MSSGRNQQKRQRERQRKLVEMMQKEEVEQEEAADGEQQHSQEKGEGGESEEDGRGEWRLTWGRWLTPPGHFGSHEGTKEQERDASAELGRLQ